jgi:hypothetical protein
MLVHEKLQDTTETKTTATTVDDRPTHAAPQAPKSPNPRRRRRWLTVMIPAGALAVTAVVATIPGSEPDPAQTSSDRVETNRTATLQDLAVSTTSSDRVETNRTATLQDLASGS